MKQAGKKPKQVDEDTGSWIVYDPETKQIRKRFKTHTAGKSYAKTHGLGFASSEYYFDNVKEKSVAETQTDYQKHRQRERDVDAGRPVKPLPKNPQTDYARKRAKEKRDMELGEEFTNQSLRQNIPGKSVIEGFTIVYDRATKKVDIMYQDQLLDSFKYTGGSAFGQFRVALENKLRQLRKDGKGPGKTKIAPNRNYDQTFTSGLSHNVDLPLDVQKQMYQQHDQDTKDYGITSVANPGKWAAIRRAQAAKRDKEAVAEMHEPQKFIVTINGKPTSPLYADMADRLYTAAKRAQPNARIEKTPAPTAQRQKGIDRVKAGYGDEDALELHEQLPSTPPSNRKEYLDQRDKLFRMLAVETNPANKQIIKTAIKNLDVRYGSAKDPIREENSTSSEAVEIAIIRRILVAHTDLIMEFGLDKVTQAIEEVAYNVGDVDEIGTSDVSAYVNQVKQILGVPEELDEKWSQKYKNSINCASPKGFSQRAHCASKKK